MAAWIALIAVLVALSQQGCDLGLDVSVSSRDGLETHQRLVSSRSREADVSVLSRSRLFTFSAQDVHWQECGFCHKLFPATWCPWSRFHVIEPCKLTLCIIIIQRRRNARPRNVETTGGMRVSFRPRNIFPHFTCCSLNFHSLSLCCLHTIKTSHSVGTTTGRILRNKLTKHTSPARIWKIE